MDAGSSGWWGNSPPQTGSTADPHLSQGPSSLLALPLEPTWVPGANLHLPPPMDTSADSAAVQDDCVHWTPADPGGLQCCSALPDVPVLSPRCQEWGGC